MKIKYIIWFFNFYLILVLQNQFLNSLQAAKNSDSDIQTIALLQTSDKKRDLIEIADSKVAKIATSSIESHLVFSEEISMDKIISLEAGCICLGSGSFDILKGIGLTCLGTVEFTVGTLILIIASTKKIVVQIYKLSNRAIQWIKQYYEDKKGE